MKYKNLLLFSVLTIGNPVFATAKIFAPINKSFDVQSPIVSGRTGYFLVPNWLYAHIKCTVKSKEPNDLFALIPDYVAENFKVDGKNIGPDKLFSLNTAGIHYFEFDIVNGNQGTNPQEIYNGSTEPLEFSNCIATSE